MVKIKKKNYIRNVFILSFIILFIIIVFHKNKFNSFEDILFLKLLGKDNKIHQEEFKYNYNKKENTAFEFNVNYKKTNFKSVDLLETANKTTKVQEKIAPGTSGNFSIILKTNKDSNYKIEFESYNKKPKNLKFKAFCDGKVISEEKNTLEELETDLEGVLQKHQKKIIIINWYWDYENNQFENTDIEDTEDSKKIKQYKFGICAKGEEI